MSCSTVSAARASLKTIRVQDAVGSVLCHDITRIVPGESKGPVFRKGHVIAEEDIPVLLEVGKEHLYVYEALPGFVHEDDAARRIVNAAMGDNLVFSAPKEGRINALADCDGLLVVDVERLLEVNSLEQISFATMHTMTPVRKGQAVAGTRVVPLMADERQLEAVERICRADGVKKALVEIRPFRSFRVGIVTTGSEVFHGRIKDRFGPVLRGKFAEFGSNVIGQSFAPDDEEQTREAILSFISAGADMVVVTGGCLWIPTTGPRRPSVLPEEWWNVTELPLFPEPCFCFPISARRPYSVCRAVSCTTRPVFLISSCRASSRDLRSRRGI